MMNINTQRIFFGDYITNNTMSQKLFPWMQSLFSVRSAITGLTALKYNAVMKNNRQGAAEFKEEQVNAVTLVTLAAKTFFSYPFLTLQVQAISMI